MGIDPDLMKLGARWYRVKGLVSPSSSDMYTPITILPALRFQRDQINSLRNGRDSDLKQNENAFKDPEDGFWEKKQLRVSILS